MEGLIRSLRLTPVALVLAAAATDAGTWTVGRLASDCDCPPQNPNCCNFHDNSIGAEVGGGIELALKSPSVIPGDTVLVWPGSLSGGYTIKFTMKSGVTLLAKGYPDSTVVIQGFAGGEPAIRMTACSEVTEISGFTISWDAGSTALGGGLSAYVSSGKIRNNTFSGCRGGVGAAVYLQTSQLELENNLFVDNECLTGGGVLAISGGMPLIRNNTFSGSLATFGAEGSAIYATGSDFLFLNNVVHDSQGASAIFCGGLNSPTLSCNLFFDNQLGGFGGQCPDSTGTSGNFIADPLFCSAPPDPFAFCADSPALIGPCGAIGFQSPYGTCAPCATGIAATLRSESWGRIKAGYR